MKRNMSYTRLTKAIVVPILFFLLSFSIHITAQQIIHKDILSPQAANLGRYGDIPFSPFTGKADIRIPLYSFTFRNVNLPIFLSYDNGGVLLNSLPGWTGHNWTLSAGGVITRVAQGRYDEYIYPQRAQIGVNTYNYFQSPGAINTLMAQPDDANNALREAVIYGTYDLSPDIFYFNFMGISGRFFLGNDGEWKVDCEENIEVIFDYEDNDNFIYPLFHVFPSPLSSDYQPKTIKGFVLRDGNGTKYHFGGSQDAIEYRTDFFRMNEYEETGSWIANSWYLTKVADRHGNVIYTLDYKRGCYMAQVINSTVRTKVNNSGTSVWGDFGNNYETSNYDFPYLIEITAPLYLSHIYLADGRYLFFRYKAVEQSSHYFYPSYYCCSGPYEYLKTRQNPNNIKKFYYLQADGEPSQYQANPGSDERMQDPLSATGFELLQDIYISAGADGVYNYELNYDMRAFPMLTAVKLMNSAIHYDRPQASIGKYSLKYDRLDYLPADHLTKAVDHWGYYNGHSYEVPKGAYPDYSSFKAQRDPDSTCAKFGLLQEIVYPTGGSSLFTYESHDFSKYLTLDRQSMRDSMGIAGGMRIKSITEYEDTTHTKILSRRTYSYRIPGKTLSSGQLFSPPCYYWQGWKPYTEDESIVDYSYFRTSSIVPLSNSFGTHIGYSYVEETTEDGSSTLYHYSNISFKKDSRFCVDFNDGTLSPHDKFCEHNYARGKLLSKTLFDSNGKKKQETTYTYRTDDVKNEFIYTSNLEFENSANSGAFAHYNGGVYKLFYPKYDVVREDRKTYYGEYVSVEQKVYEKANFHKSISDGSYSHTVDLRLLCSETYTKANETTKTIYTYPWQESSPVYQQLYGKQFFLVPISIEQKRNDLTIKKTKTLYNNFGGLLLPEYTLEYKRGEMADTLTHYISYTSTGALTKYKELGKAPVNLQWCINDNFLQRRTVGDSQTTLYMYSDKNLLTTIIHPNGNTWYYNYDDMGRLTEIKDRNRHPQKRFQYHYRHR